MCADIIKVKLVLLAKKVSNGLSVIRVLRVNQALTVVTVVLVQKELKGEDGEVEQTLQLLAEVPSPN